MDNLEAVYNEWSNNLQFREAFKKDPQQALETWGLTLSDDELKKMLKLKELNEELDKRINK